MTRAAMPSASSARTQLLATAAVLGAMAVGSALALGIDDRLIHGVSVWDKPLKFDFSLALHLLTLWYLVDRLTGRARAGTGAGPGPGAVRTMYWSTVVCATCALLEALYITLQAARGRGSHYNRETPLESFLYFGAMGPVALLILASTCMIGWTLWRHGDRSALPGLRSGGIVGLLLASLLTLVAVVPLSAGFVDGLGHWVGGVRTDAHGMPLTGWATRGGDLRVPHFFATHLMQALPLAGLAADRFDPGRARAWVAVAAAVGTAIVGFTLWQALAGRPFAAL